MDHLAHLGSYEKILAEALLRLLAHVSESNDDYDSVGNACEALKSVGVETN